MYTVTTPMSFTHMPAVVIHTESTFRGHSHSATRMYTRFTQCSRGHYDTNVAPCLILRQCPVVSFTTMPRGHVTQCPAGAFTTVHQQPIHTVRIVVIHTVPPLSFTSVPRGQCCTPCDKTVKFIHTVPHEDHSHSAPWSKFKHMIAPWNCYCHLQIIRTHAKTCVMSCQCPVVSCLHSVPMVILHMYTIVIHTVLPWSFLTHMPPCHSPNLQCLPCVISQQCPVVTVSHTEVPRSVDSQAAGD